MSTAKQTSRILEVDNGVSLMSDSMLIDDTGTSELQAHRSTTLDYQLGLNLRAFYAAGAAFLSAILVNPLDVAKGCRFWHPLEQIFSVNRIGKPQLTPLCLK